MNKKITVVVRIVLGLFLLSVGISGLLNLIFAFMPAPQYPEPANQFIIALNTSYITVVVSLVSFLVGISLLINRFVPLALVIYAPISLNMLLFHVFMDISSIFPALVLGVLHVYLLLTYIENYKPFLKSFF